MSLWLDVARVAAAANVVLLLVLGWVWLENYRDHGASHTLGLLVVAGFLLVENLLWLYLYLPGGDLAAWFGRIGGTVQASIAMLCGLELVALLVLARITWQ